MMEMRMMGKRKEDKLVICEHCGHIVQERDLAENTLLCFWCFKALMLTYRRMDCYKKKRNCK